MVFLSIYDVEADSERIWNHNGTGNVAREWQGGSAAMIMGNYIYKVDVVTMKDFLRRTSEDDVKQERKAASKNEAVGFAGVLEKECSKIEN